MAQLSPRRQLGLVGPEDKGREKVEMKLTWRESWRKWSTSWCVFLLLLLLILITCALSRSLTLSLSLPTTATTMRQANNWINFDQDWCASIDIQPAGSFRTKSTWANGNSSSSNYYYYHYLTAPQTIVRTRFEANFEASLGAAGKARPKLSSRPAANGLKHCWLLLSGYLISSPLLVPHGNQVIVIVAVSLYMTFTIP